MEKRFIHFFGALVVLFTASLVNAEWAYGADGASSQFEVRTPDNKFGLGIRGYVQHNNVVDFDRENWNFEMTLRRARVSLLGSALDSRVTFHIQTAFDEEKPSLTEYSVNLALARSLNLRFGYFRTPFTRYNTMSDSQTQFVRHATPYQTFSLKDGGRDIGIMAHSGIGGAFQWGLALVRQGLVGRLSFNHNGIDGYDLTDFRGGSFRFSLGLSGFYQTDYKHWKPKDLRGGVDLLMKANGFSSNAAFFIQRTWVNDEGKNAMGANLDVGYLVSKRVEPIIRGEWVTDRGRKNNNFGVHGGLNYYAYGHHLKFQLHGGANFVNDGNETKWHNANAGIQLQFAI